MTPSKTEYVLRTAEDYEYVRRQLSLVEDALKSLEDEIRPQSEERFALIAESYREMIAKLQHQLRQYETVHGVPSA